MQNSRFRLSVASLALTCACLSSSPTLDVAPLSQELDPLLSEDVTWRAPEPGRAVVVLSERGLESLPEGIADRRAQRVLESLVAHGFDPRSIGHFTPAGGGRAALRERIEAASDLARKESGPLLLYVLGAGTDELADDIGLLVEGKDSGPITCATLRAWIECESEDAERLRAMIVLDGWASVHTDGSPVTATTASTWSIAALGPWRDEGLGAGWDALVGQLDAREEVPGEVTITVDVHDATSPDLAPPGARIELDKLAQSADGARSTLTLRPGRHELRVSAPGYLIRAHTVEIEARHDGWTLNVPLMRAFTRVYGRASIAGGVAQVQGISERHEELPFRWRSPVGPDGRFELSVPSDLMELELELENGQRWDFALAERRRAVGDRRWRYEGVWEVDLGRLWGSGSSVVPPQRQSPAQAPSTRTLLVDALGAGAYTSLKEAIAAARVGDGLLLAPGVYAEPGLVVNKAVRITANGPGVVVRTPAGDPLRVTARVATFEGITLRVDDGVQVDRGALVLDGCTVEAGSSSTALRLVGEGAELTLVSCVVRGAQIGVEAARGSSVRCRGGSIDASEFGVKLESVAQAELNGVAVGGERRGRPMIGLLVTSSDSGLPEAQVIVSRFLGCGRVGVVAERSATVRMVGSEVTGSAENGIAVRGEARLSTWNCRVRHNRVGLALEGGAIAMHGGDVSLNDGPGVIGRGHPREWWQSLGATVSRNCRTFGGADLEGIGGAEAGSTAQPSGPSWQRP
ncbi:MAG: hypothetical protein GY711_15105 [bacterium]|nr:hypothetical protein [bacterium]